MSKVIVHSPDGGWGWLVTFSSFVVNFLIDGVGYTFGVFFPEFLRYFGESKAKTQLLSSIMIGNYFVFGPVVGGLVNIYGSRRVAASGAVIASIGLFFSSFSQNLDVMIIFYSIITGIGFSLMYLPSIVMIGVYFERRRALAMGLAVCGAGVGNFVFAPLSKFLLEEYGWRGTMWVISAIMLNGVIVAYCAYRPLGTERNIRQIYKTNGRQYDKDAEKNSDVCYQQILSSIKDVFDFSFFQSPTMVIYALSCFVVMFGLFIPYNFLPVFASDLNMSTNQGAFLISLIGISNTVSRVLAGYVTDKPWADTLVVTNSALLIGGVFTCFVPFYTTFVALSIYAVLVGAVIAVFTCLRSILIAELLGVHRLSSSFGILGLSMGISAFVGSPVAGSLSDMSGDYSLAFYLSGICFGLGGLICLPLRRISEWEKRRRPNLSDTSGFDPKEDTNTEELLSTGRRSSVNTTQEG